jgi:hypothetical protein
VAATEAQYSLSSQKEILSCRTSLAFIFCSPLLYGGALQSPCHAPGVAMSTLSLPFGARVVPWCAEAVQCVPHCSEFPAHNYIGVRLRASLPERSLNLHATPCATKSDLGRRNVRARERIGHPRSAP